MATTKVGTNLDLQSASAIQNAMLNPLADLAAMNAYATSNGYGADQESIVAYNKDDNKIYVWDGTQWITADKDEEIIDLIADPLVTPPTVTPNTNFGILRQTGLAPLLYSYDQDTSTWHLQSNIVNLGAATAPDLTLLDTTQVNDEGKVWYVFADGTFKLQEDGTDTYYEVRENVDVVVGANTFNITDGSATLTNWRTGITAVDKALFRIQVSFADSVEIYECVETTDETYSFNSNIAQTGARVSVIYVGK